jgi:hypothetical protein
MRNLSPFFRILALGVLVLGAGTADAKPSKAPKKKEPAGPPFDRAAAVQSLSAVELSRCKVPGGPRGEGHVVVSFTPKGEAAKAEVDEGVFVGTKVQKCIEDKFKSVTVPPFAGDPVTVGKKFALK